jgi:FMN-dependent NADH-azoreductase
MTELTEIWKQANPQNNVTFRQSNNIMNLSHLKKDLQSPEFQKRLASMKNRQQQYIMSILRKRGQLVELPNGGNIILAAPNMTTFTIPISLKRKPIELWTDEELIWLNM